MFLTSILCQLGQYELLPSGKTGPLPSPDMLREYEAAMPGAADRLFTMAEKANKPTSTMTVGRY